MKTDKVMKWLPATLIALMFASSSAFAASGNYSSDVDLEPVEELIEKGDFAGAIDELYAVLDLDPDNPDILSLLGFCHRKKRSVRRRVDLLRVGLAFGA